MVVRTPSPPPRPETIDDVKLEYFTIDSLYKMLGQFKKIAPSGLITVKEFAEILNDLVLLNYENEILPEQWANLNQSQVLYLFFSYLSFLIFIRQNR